MFPDLLRDDVFRLETRRLWLRWPRAADAALIASLAGEREVAEMTAHIPHPYPPGAAAEFVLKARPSAQVAEACGLGGCARCWRTAARTLASGPMLARRWAAVTLAHSAQR
jgi:hypothetical protein